jgi:hypothetical protein
MEMGDTLFNIRGYRMSGTAVSATSLDAATMTARLVSEGLLGLAPASRLFGTTRNGRPKHPATLTRYYHDGVRLANGRVVRLECVKVGSQLMTSEAAVLRFIAEQQDDAPGASTPNNQPTPTPARRQRAAAAASAELDAILNTKN